MSGATLLWFRQDLRLADNPALAAAVQAGTPIVPVYIFSPDGEPDEKQPVAHQRWALGGASRWWLHHSLSRLDEDLRRCGSRLVLRMGTDSRAELLDLARDCGAVRVLWNRRYEPASIAQDRNIKQALRTAGIDTQSFNSALLHEPWTVQSKAGTPFQVFSAFWRHCLAQAETQEPAPAPQRLAVPGAWPASRNLDELKLLPRLNWALGLKAAWTPGSAAGHAMLECFLRESFEDYGGVRDRPDLSGTSRLSPYLHFGEIGPREIWHATRRFALRQGRHTTWAASQFLTELGWREFAHHLLYHFPHTPSKPLRDNYAAFPWKCDPTALSAWQRGATGYPLVDAGMRQLWQTGWMHNRVRMVAASFLVKDLLQPWTDGAHWFWDTLVDADLASNTLGWQWVAGCGADAAPYFRIFNPTTQATKFDPEGTYVREWIPELARLPGEWIHQPWAAPPQVLSACGVRLGENYPKPIVDHKTARAAALQALATLKR